MCYNALDSRKHRIWRPAAYLFGCPGGEEFSQQIRESVRTTDFCHLKASQLHVCTTVEDAQDATTASVECKHLVKVGDVSFVGVTIFDELLEPDIDFSTDGPC
jgi:hypothetical protein